MVILRLFKYLIIVLCFLISTCIILAATNFGTRSIYKALTLILPGHLNIEHISGSLINHLELNNVSYEDRSHNILGIEKFNLTWGLGGFGQKIIIHEMNISSFTYHLSSESINPAIKRDINFQLKSSGDFNLIHPNAINMQFNIQSIKGTFNEKPVAGDINFIVHNGNLKINNAQLAIGDAKANITGSITDEWHIDWRFEIKELGDYVATLKGALRSQGTIRGKAKTPSVRGDLNSENINIADYFIPHMHCFFTADMNKSAINFKISDINFSLPLWGTQIESAYINGQYKKALNNIVFEATLPTHVLKQNNASTDDGVGQLNGEVNLSKPTLKANIHLTGKNLWLVNTHEYKVHVTPDIYLDYHANDTNVHGKIAIPEAKITPQDFSSTISLPDDAVILHKKSLTHREATSLPVHETEISNTNNTAKQAFNVNLQIDIGDSVFLDYAHLKTRLTGSIHLKQTEDAAMLATGELHTVQGSYQAYGQTLTIEQGRLIYTGSLLTNPGINIRATKTIKEIKTAHANDVIPATTRSHLSVGILATGTVAHPKITLYSNPAGLSQNDILSYLIFGYPQSKINDKNSLALLNNMLASIVSNAGSSGAKGGFTNKMKNMFGLAELDVGTMDYSDGDKNNIENATVVSIGKKLGKRLFVQYTTGIFQPISIFSLKYQINKRLALKSETSSIENGADLIYEIEKD